MSYGNIVMEKYSGKSFSMKQTSDGGYVLCGFTDSNDINPTYHLEETNNIG